MTTEFYPSLHLWGQSFSPTRFAKQTGFAFAEANEVGEIGVTGPDRDCPSHYVAAIIRPPETIPLPESLWWITDNVASWHTRKFCREHGITEELFYLTVHYKSECCMIFAGPLMKSFGALGIPFVITFVQDHDSPDSFGA